MRTVELIAGPLHGRVIQVADDVNHLRIPRLEATGPLGALESSPVPWPNREVVWGLPLDDSGRRSRAVEYRLERDGRFWFHPDGTGRDTP